MIKLYLADLKAYNEGILKGSWCNLPMPVTELEMIVEALNDEIAIHDYEAPFHISEYSNIHKINEMMLVLKENNFEADVLNMIDDFMSLDIEELESELEQIHTHHYTVTTNHYIGSNELREDFAQWYYEEINGFNVDDIPSAIASAINWSHVFDELEISMNVHLSNDIYKLYWSWK